MSAGYQPQPAYGAYEAPPPGTTYGYQPQQPYYPPPPQPGFQPQQPTMIQPTGGGYYPGQPAQPPPQTIIVHERDSGDDCMKDCAICALCTALCCFCCSD